jgi:hypothetical protein
MAMLPWKLSDATWREHIEAIRAPSAEEIRQADAAAARVRMDLGTQVVKPTRSHEGSERTIHLMKQCTPFARPQGDNQPPADLAQLAGLFQAWLALTDFNDERPPERQLRVPRGNLRKDDKGEPIPLQDALNPTIMRIVWIAGSSWWCSLIDEIAGEAEADAAHHVDKSKSPPVVTCWPIRLANNMAKAHLAARRLLDPDEPLPLYYPLLTTDPGITGMGNKVGTYDMFPIIMQAGTLQLHQIADPRNKSARKSIEVLRQYVVHRFHTQYYDKEIKVSTNKKDYDTAMANPHVIRKGFVAKTGTRSTGGGSTAGGAGTSSGAGGSGGGAGGAAGGGNGAGSGGGGSSGSGSGGGAGRGGGRGGSGGGRGGQGGGRGQSQHAQQAGASGGAFAGYQQQQLHPGIGVTQQNPFGPSPAVTYGAQHCGPGMAFPAAPPHAVQPPPQNPFTFHAQQQQGGGPPRGIFTRCMAPGCGSVPPFGASKGPFCRNHSATHEYNNITHAVRLRQTGPGTGAMPPTLPGPGGPQQQQALPPGAQWGGPP